MLIKTVWLEYANCCKWLSCSACVRSSAVHNQVPSWVPICNVIRADWHYMNGSPHGCAKIEQSAVKFIYMVIHFVNWFEISNKYDNTCERITFCELDGIATVLQLQLTHSIRNSNRWWSIYIQFFFFILFIVSYLFDRCQRCRRIMHGSAIRVCRTEPLCTCGVLVERIHWGSQSTIMNEAHLKDKHLTADANDRYIYYHVSTLSICVRPIASWYGAHAEYPNDRQFCKILHWKRLIAINC